MRDAVRGPEDSTELPYDLERSLDLLCAVVASKLLLKEKNRLQPTLGQDPTPLIVEVYIDHHDRGLEPVDFRSIDPALLRAGRQAMRKINDQDRREALAIRLHYTELSVQGPKMPLN
jgi:hypothetical protein